MSNGFLSNGVRSTEILDPFNKLLNLLNKKLVEQNRSTVFCRTGDPLNKSVRHFDSVAQKYQSNLNPLNKIQNPLNKPKYVKQKSLFNKIRSTKFRSNPFDTVNPFNKRKSVKQTEPIR